MIQDSWHTVNIVIHVVVGATALLLGLYQLFTAKGGRRHTVVGRWFVRATWVVVGTAATGLVLFRFGAFLAVLTLLVSYWVYSGVRAVKIRDIGPGLQDGFASIAALLAVAAFFHYLPRIRLPWAPAVIYPTLATLAMVALYDLSRFTFPLRVYQWLWRYEHIVKILGAHGAIVAAFCGTVLAAFQPMSQVAPSVIWTALQVGFVVHAARRARRLPVAVAPSSAGWRKS